MLWDSIDSAYVWTSQLYDAFGIGFTEFLIGVVLLFSLFTFVIKPFIGSHGSSDKVKKSRGEGSR